MSFDVLNRANRIKYNERGGNFMKLKNGMKVVITKDGVKSTGIIKERPDGSGFFFLGDAAFNVHYCHGWAKLDNGWFVFTLFDNGDCWLELAKEFNQLV